MSERALVPMIRLDLLSVVATGRTWLTYLVVVAGMPLAAGAELAMPMATAGGLLLALTLFTMDDTYGLRALYGGLPLRRRTVIVGHYAVMALLVVAITVFGLAAAVVASRVQGTATSGLLFQVVATIGVESLLVGLFAPLYLAFGARRAAVVLMAAMMALLGIGILVSGFPEARRLASLLDGVAAESWLPGLVLLVGVVAFVVSCLVAIRIYERQDH